MNQKILNMLSNINYNIKFLNEILLKIKSCEELMIEKRLGNKEDYKQLKKILSNLNKNKIKTENKIIKIRNKVLVILDFKVIKGLVKNDKLNDLDISNIKMYIKESKELSSVFDLNDKENEKGVKNVNEFNFKINDVLNKNIFIDIKNIKKLENVSNDILKDTINDFEYHIALKGFGSNVAMNNIYSLFNNEIQIKKEMVYTNKNLNKILQEIQARVNQFLQMGVQSYEDYLKKIETLLSEGELESNKDFRNFIPRIFIWVNSIDNITYFDEKEEDDFLFDKISKNLERIANANVYGVHLIIINSSNSELIKNIKNRVVFNNYKNNIETLILNEKVNNEYTLNDFDGNYYSNVPMSDYIKKKYDVLEE